MSKSDELRLYKLALHFIPGIGAVHAKNLISYLGGIDQVFKAGRRQLRKVPGIGEKRCNDILKSNALQLAENEIKKLDNLGIELVFYLDPDYPTRLKHFSTSPIVLYKKGKYDLNSNRMIAMVGTRSPTSRGIDICETIVEKLKPYNVCIVSGLAYGIDSIAHRKAIECDIPTIGILGSGLDTIYPGSNLDLSYKMALNGAVISEFPLGTKPDRENFPKRNRIIASLSDALIVIESAKKGGSVITSEYANSYSKDVFAVPGRITDLLSEGCNHMIKTHKAHLLNSVDDIAYIMRWDKRNVQTSLAFDIDLVGNELNIYNLIKEKDVIGLDRLSFESRISLSELSSVLLNLEFKGLIKSKPGKKYILASKS